MPLKRLRILKECLEEWVTEPPVTGLPGGGAGHIVARICQCSQLNAEGLRLNHRWSPTYLGIEGWPAIIKFFRLSPSKTHWLFDEYFYPPYTGDGSPINGPTLQDVLHRLETVLDHISRPVACLC